MVLRSDWRERGGVVVLLLWGWRNRAWMKKTRQWNCIIKSYERKL
jgi:hypothetical protein